jgi:hypothetical protein
MSAPAAVGWLLVTFPAGAAAGLLDLSYSPRFQRGRDEPALGTKGHGQSRPDVISWTRAPWLNGEPAPLNVQG